MTQPSLELVTVYVDADVNEHLADQKLARGIAKATLFRRYLAAGMRAGKGRPDLLPAADADERHPPLVLKTVYLDPRVADKLRAEALDARTRRNDLVRRYVRLGMSVLAGVNAVRP